MIKRSGYLLDSNVFIDAKNRHYGLDFCPAFWDWLILQNQEEKVASIKQVSDELCRGQDELTPWVRTQNRFFLESDIAIDPYLSQVSDWASGGEYEPSAVSDFLDSADYWLIAYALTHQCIIVTHEKYESTSRRIKIPNACEHFDIKYTDPFTMLRREKAKFILDPSLQ